jgi:HPt (histidine-containing phosphotransfer) domain-containing protein
MPSETTDRIRTATTTPVTVAPLPTVPAVATARRNTPLGVDAVLVSDLADDPDMMELVQQFLQILPERIVIFDTNRQPEQRKALAAAAHQLKGAAGGYGYMRISELARTVERYASAGGTQDECDRAVNALLATCHAAIRGGALSTGGGVS